MNVSDPTEGNWSSFLSKSSMIETLNLVSLESKIIYFNLSITKTNLYFNAFKLAWLISSFYLESSSLSNLVYKDFNLFYKFYFSSKTNSKRSDKS